MSVLKQPSTETFIKVRYHCQGKTKNKMVTLKSNDYTQLCNKIVQGYTLDINKMYAMFYYDNHKQSIIVSNQDDLDIMIKTATSSLTIEIQQTDNQEYNFMEAIVTLKEEEAVLRMQAQIRQMEEYKQQIRGQIQQQIRKNLDTSLQKSIDDRDKIIAQRDKTIRQQSQIIAEKNKRIQQLTIQVQKFNSMMEQKRSEMLQNLNQFRKKIEDQVKLQIKTKMHSYQQRKERELRQEQMRRKRKGFLHKGYRCQGKNCRNQGEIRGIRYKCFTCTDFNFCEECEANSGQDQKHDKSHILGKIYNEGQRFPTRNNSNVSEVTKGECQSSLEKKEVKQAKNTKVVSKQIPENMQKIQSLKLMGIPQNDIKQLLERYPKQTVNFLADRYFG